MENINFFAQNINDDLKSIIKKYSDDKIFVLVDDNTFQYCFPLIKGAFLKEPILIEIPAGEKMKNIETVKFLWDFLSNHNADRNSLLINLGGGVITDMGGFVASTFQRGIDFLNIPTTILAQVDASVGGKTGVNLNGLKNQIGLFKQPVKNIISSDFLRTLPTREITAGFVEIVKHALISSTEEWQKIKVINPEKINIENIQKIIEESIKIKTDFVQSDPLEKGRREALNFGHTIGHAVETYISRKGISILHGEAVAIGLIAELFLSNKIFSLDFKKLFEIVEYLATFFTSFELAYEDYEQIYEIMKHDKKNRNNQIRFTLLKDVGEVAIGQMCEKETIFEALNFYFQVKK